MHVQSACLSLASTYTWRIYILPIINKRKSSPLDVLTSRRRPADAHNTHIVRTRGLYIHGILIFPPKWKGRERNTAHRYIYAERRPWPVFFASHAGIRVESLGALYRLASLRFIIQEGTTTALVTLRYHVFNDNNRSLMYTCIYETSPKITTLPVYTVLHT